jgi:hypothetical protein
MRILAFIFFSTVSILVSVLAVTAQAHLRLKEMTPSLSTEKDDVNAVSDDESLSYGGRYLFDNDRFRCTDGDQCLGATCSCESGCKYHSANCVDSAFACAENTCDPLAAPECHGLCQYDVDAHECPSPWLSCDLTTGCYPSEVCHDVMMVMCLQAVEFASHPMGDVWVRRVALSLVMADVMTRITVLLTSSHWQNVKLRVFPSTKWIDHCAAIIRDLVFPCFMVSYSSVILGVIIIGMAYLNIMRMVNVT